MIVAGYLGAIGIVAFGLRSAYAAFFGGNAAALNPLDFAMLAAAAALLALYAARLGDLVFLIANSVSAVTNAAVALAAFRARRTSPQE